jgi:hypothetical protein
MTNSKFKDIKTNIKTLYKIYQPYSDMFIGVEINGVEYFKSKKRDGLTTKQLEFFEFLPDYNGKEISL